jgi:DtxR family Mn-dependent transcriptional regulator
MRVHEGDLADQELEELAEEIWTLGEDGSDRVEELRARTRTGDFEAALGKFVTARLGQVDQGRIRLTSDGRALAELQIRRHRLAEMLLSSVLEMRDEGAVNRTACVMEHVLGSEATDSVCAFLGHPKFCPHGKQIPAGRCCRSFAESIPPLVQPLHRFAIGATGRVVHIVTKEPDRLVRLSSLGLMPGVIVRLQQRSPATVVQIGETTLALDAVIASEIFVRRVD